MPLLYPYVQHYKTLREVIELSFRDPAQRERYLIAAGLAEPPTGVDPIKYTRANIPDQIYWPTIKCQSTLLAKLFIANASFIRSVKTETYDASHDIDAWRGKHDNPAKLIKDVMESMGRLAPYV